MTSETKKRIAAINSGIIPEGYKKTKVGIVPVEWEEKKGTELFKYIRNGFVGTVSPFYVEKGHKYIQGNNIKDGKIVSNNLMYVNDDFYDNHKNSILKKDDIIIIQSGDVGKCALVTSEYENASCHALIIMSPKSKTNTFFISYLLNSPLGFDMIKGFVTGNVLHHVLASDYKELKYILPPLHEQQKIAEILSTQDKLIELQEKKIEKLKELKKAYLQKMFPKKGSKYPELRFKGFTDPWEQRKFSELTEIRSASRVHKEEWQTSGVPFYRSSDVMAALNGTENEKAFISEELYEKLSAVSGKLEKGDVLITGGGSVGKPYIVPNNEPLYTKDADLLWIKNNENLDPYFVYTFFFSPTFTDYLNSVSHVGTIAHYTITQLGETPITLPCVSEQQKIGDFFRNLDNLITLHQRKLEQEKQKKKALMQLLLTGKVRYK